MLCQRGEEPPQLVQQSVAFWRVPMPDQSLNTHDPIIRRSDAPFNLGQVGSAIRIDARQG